MPNPIHLVNSNGSSQIVIDKCEISTLECCNKLLLNFENAATGIDFVEDNEIWRMRNVV